MNDQLDVAASTIPSCNTAPTNGRPWHKWRKMDECRPEHQQRVLFWYNGKAHLGVYLTKTARFYLGDFLLLQADYWMPLPDAPDGEGSSAVVVVVEGGA